MQVVGYEDYIEFEDGDRHCVSMLLFFVLEAVDDGNEAF